MKLFCLTFSLSIFWAVISYAQNITRGPYLQVGTPNSIQIRWRTDVPTNSRITYGLTPTTITNAVLDTTKTIEHIVNIRNLQPITKYFYTVGTSERLLNNDPENFFFTQQPSNSERKIRIWATGDCGTGTQNQLDVKDQYLKYVGDNYTDAWLLLGDNAYLNGSDAEYQDNFFKPYQINNKIIKQTCIYPCPGNHDYYTPITSQNDKKNPYYNIFSMPTRAEAGGVASGSESYYSYNIGNVHFVSLDSYGLEQNQYRLWVGFTEQRAWLKKDLEANRQRWTIVYFHHPPFTMGSHNSDTEEELVNLRQYLVPVLEEYKIDLLLTGHSHNYERSYLMKGHYGQMNTYDAAKHRVSTSNGRYDGKGDSCPYIKPQQDGTVYVVAGSAGFVGGEQTTWPHKAMAYSLTEAGSLAIEVEANRLDAKYITEKGEIKDQFTIFKDVNKTQNITILPSQKITATASWAGTYKWANVGNASTRAVTFAPAQTGVYSVKDEQNCLADNFNVIVKPCAVGTFTIPQSDGTTKTATLECTATDGFTHYYDDRGILLLSIKKGTNEIGKISDGSLKITLQGDQNTISIPQKYPDNYGFLSNGFTALKRFWNVVPTPELAASKSVQVRLYYPDQDFQTLQKSTLSKDLSNYYLLKINGLSNDLANPANGHSNVPLALSPTETGAWLSFWGDSLKTNQWANQLINQVNNVDMTVSLLKGQYVMGATTDGKQQPAYYTVFEAKYKPYDEVELAWQSIAEFKNTQFVVERSLDKAKFDSIGVVKSQAGSNKIANLKYLFSDKKAIYPSIYYRLRAKNGDGVYYSKTISIDVPITSVSPTENAEFLIYPNPTTIGKVQFAKPIKTDGFRIVSIDGKTVLTQVEKAEIESINVNELPAGIYQLQIFSKGLWLNQKLVIGEK